MIAHKSGVPQFLPFSVGTQDGKEIPATWFKYGDSQLLMSTFNRDPAFIFLPLDWAKAALEAAECINETQEAQIVNGPAARHSETHRKVLAQMYSKAMTFPLNASEIPLHLECSKVLVNSRVPGQDTTRILAEAKQLHIKNPKPTKVVIDITPQFVQDLLDSYTSIGGTALLRTRAAAGSGLVVRPTILREDL